MPKAWFGGFLVKFTAGSRHLPGKIGCSREATKKMIAFLNFIDDGGVHLSNLAAVAFSKHDEHECACLAIDLMRDDRFLLMNTDNFCIYLIGLDAKITRQIQNC